MKNKYQKALDRLRILTGEPIQVFKTGEQMILGLREVAVLQELVDKEIPMKPLHISLLTNPPKNIIVCGNCKLEIAKVHKHCSKCGQKIDWSKDE